MDPEEIVRQDEALAAALKLAESDGTFRLTAGQRTTLRRASRAK